MTGYSRSPARRSNDATRCGPFRQSAIRAPTRDLSDPDGNICRRGDSLIDDTISRLEEGGGAASPVSSRSMAVAL